MRLQRSPFQPRGALTKYKIENKATSDEATVYLYDEISWFGVDAGQFVKDLNDVTAKTLHIRFNSPGGSVFDGTAIYNAIKQHKSKTVTHIDGLAASISSVIALASDEVRMAKNAFLMIHKPWSITIGDDDAHFSEGELLKKVGGTIAKAYMDKTGKSENEIWDIMSPPEPGKFETWMTADEALEMGFIDYIEDDNNDEKAKATLFDLSVFANVPAQLKGDKRTPTARELEAILKSSGFSNKQAKEILANGYRDEPLRDVEEVETPPVQDSQRDVETAAPRDVEETPQKKKDRTAELLTRAEVLAPTSN